MKQFHLVRTEDESGVSGTGYVAEGVIFPRIEDVQFVHGHGEKTKVVFEGEAQQ